MVVKERMCGGPQSYHAVTGGGRMVTKVGGTCREKQQSLEGARIWT